MFSMNASRTLFSLFICVLVPAPAVRATVYYVDDGGDPANTCTTWADACPDLQTALAVAGGGDQIWVATGTYKPTPGTDRTATFQLITGVEVYGGFDGTETTLEERAELFDQTILSGDIAGDDTPVVCAQNSPDCDSYGGICVDGFCIINENNDENSYSVVTGTGTDATAVLDGFTVTGGNANDVSVYISGGGMVIASPGDPTVANCTFRGNSAVFGGGISASTGCSPSVSRCMFTGNLATVHGGGLLSVGDAVVTDCTFSRNFAANAGGGMCIVNASPTVTNCTFSGNTADLTGGGMSNINEYSFPIVINCTFSGNTADRGGAMYNYNNAQPTVTNCTFSGNSANSGHGMYNERSSSPTLTNCILWDNLSSEIHNDDSTPIVTFSIVQGGTGQPWFGLGCMDADPLLVDADGSDNIVGTADDNLRLLVGSPAFNAGNYSPPGGLPPTDLDGNPRIMHGTVDLGAYEQLLVHNVTQNTYHPWIQSAIGNALHADLIEAPPGVYREAIDFLGKAVTLRSTNGREVTTIDATGLSASVVKCVNGEGPDTVLDGFTITGGTGTNPGTGFTYGGGMYNVGSSPTVTGCTFTGNTATGAGGGMSNSEYSSPLVANCTFSGNSVTGAGDGGGMFNNSNASPTVINCTFNANTAEDCGGMYNLDSSPTLSNCAFSRNIVGGSGGGMCSLRGSPSITLCTFVENRSSFGGGMYNWSSSPAVTNCTFTANVAFARGGGMYNKYNSSPVVTNCTFSANWTYTGSVCGGGGMHNWDNSSPTLTNCTFTGNSTRAGGGMGNGNNSNPTVTNCIFWGDSAVEPDDEIHNEDGSDPLVTYCDVQGGYEGTYNINEDPVFIRIPDDGGDGFGDNPGTPDVDEGANDDYGDLHLKHTSPCVDAGNDRAIVVPAAGIDLDGHPRIVDGDRDGAPGVDMGAYEYSDCNNNGVLDICDVDCDALGGACDLPDCGQSIDDDGDAFPDECEAIHNVIQDTYNATIQIAINNAVDGDVIEVPPGSYREAIDFFGKLLTLRSADGPKVTTIHAAGLGTSVVKCVSGEGPGTILEGFTITNGTGIPDQDTGETSGGGMYIEGSDPTVSNCTFAENLSFYGAGMYAGADVDGVQSNPIVANCTLTGNLSYVNGGAVFCSENCGATLVNCLVSGNFAHEYGGGMYNESGNPTLTNCTFSGNAAAQGGAIYNDAGNPAVANSVFWANDAETHPQITEFMSVSYSDVQDGYPGTGNINADPGFVDLDGPDNTPGTPDDDLRLSAGSPCIDAGDNTVVTVTTDFDGSLRFVDDPTVDPDPGNGAPPVVDMGAYEYQADCNANGVIDSVDIAEETCSDDDGNGVPDVCEADCNGNGQHDAVDIAQGISTDCDENDVPDECQPDCDADGTSDVCELPPYGTSEDCTGNEIPDECEPDCNDNDVADSCDIANGTSVDGNDNDVPDSCEMPVYNIGPDVGEIPPQAAMHGSTVEFLLYSSELGDSATYSIVAAPLPVGPINIDAATGYFFYTPDPADKRMFIVTFTAATARDSVSQDVSFEPTPLLPDEAAVLGLEPVHPVPDSESPDYIVRNVVYSLDRYNLENPSQPLVCCDPPEPPDPCPSGCLCDCGDFNWSPRNPRSITIAGKTLIFEEGLENGLFEYHDDEDIAELNLFAETVVVRSPLHFPQTNVTIYTRKLRFEDDGGWTYIDTTPVSPPSLVPGEGNGGTGLKAGDITLHLQTFHAPDDNVRFIMNGGEGQDGANGTAGPPEILPGQPGGGGSAGNLFTNLPSLPRPACAGGLPGAPGWAGDPHVYAALPDVPFGESGSMIPVGDEWSWLAPDALRMILAHAKDAYLYGHLAEAEGILAEYRGLLESYRESDAWDALDNPERDENWQFELSQLLEETTTLLHRLENNLDYFGNPAGWVPMLSFEVLYTAFEQEVDRSIRALYLAYWVGNAVKGLEAKIIALDTARAQIRAEIEAYQTQYEGLIDDIPSLEARANDIADQIDQRLIELQQLEQELLALAQDIVEERHKVPFWKKALRTLGGICKILPVGEPYVGMVGQGFDFVSNIDPDQPWSSITGQADVVTEVSQGGFAQATSDWLSALNSVDLNAPSDDAISAMLGASSPVGQTLQGLGTVTRQTQAPRTEIDAELQRIKASDPRFIDLTNRIQELINDKAALARKLASTMQMVSDLAGRISHDVLAIDGFNRDISEGTAALDHRVARYVKEMDRRARERLQKYHYYMAKAYEYRLLEPYPGDLNLGKMFDLMQTLADAEDSDENLEPNDFDALKDLYVVGGPDSKGLADIAEDIIDEFVATPGEQTSQTRVTLSADQLDRVNAGELVLLNLAELPLSYDPVFVGCEENIRILDITAYEVNGHTVEGGPDSFVKVFIQHSGVSRLRSHGSTYKFVHYTERTANRITWDFKYYPSDGTLISTEPSAEDESLLRQLLTQADWNEHSLMYSRPGADAELMITRTVSLGADVVIDSLVLDIEYDFYRQPEMNGAIASLTVRVSEKGLLPYFLVSAPDQNERQDGRGSFYRAYSPPQEFTLEAPTVYGSWQFEKWTDCAGNDLPGGPMTEPQLALSLENDPDFPCDEAEAQIVVAQFCRFGLLGDMPVLVSCMEGPFGQSDPSCLCVDDDDDGDVDLADFAALQLAFKGQ